MDTIKMIKQDAQIQLTVGTGFLLKLQQLLTSMVSERSAEELEQFSAALQRGTTELPEQWMEDLATVTALVSELERNAERQGHTYEEALEANQPES